MFQKVILAVDGSEESKKAEALATRFQGEIVVLHVRETVYSGAASWSPEWTPELEALIADVVGRLNRVDGRARSEVRDASRGHAGQVIAEVASEMRADLIVKGSKGRSRVAGFVLGSVAGRVVHSAKCPVLVAR
jgi:nucleotide-binding universal stress UspA family protein